MRSTLLVSAAALMMGCANSATNYVTGIETFNSRGELLSVVEIPAGSCQKWEVNKSTGEIEWERINSDSMRVVNYLPYPANYGFIPQTLMDKAKGGDGDPIDLFILGDGVSRGSVIACHTLGVITMLDQGEQDDKLIAVALDGHFGDVRTLAELNSRYGGTVEILTTWLKNYKRAGGVEIVGVEPISDINEYLDRYR